MIFLGADHRGYELKEKIKKYLDSQEIEFKDFGTNSTEVAHYPLIAEKVCSSMDPSKDKAILICGSGIGMSMIASMSAFDKLFSRFLFFFFAAPDPFCGIKLPPWI